MALKAMARGIALKIVNEIQPDHQIKLTVEVEPEVLEASKRKAARRIAERVRIPGFRPGKAPYSVIQKQVGDAAILEDAIDILLDEVYPKALEEAGVSPYGPGSLEKIVSMEPPTFEFVIPMSPEVDLGDYRQVRLEAPKAEVSQEDVDSYLESLRARNASLEPVERPVEESDLVYLTLKAEVKDESDKSRRILVGERRYPVIIDSKDADISEEWPFPGFARGLIGLTVGQEKTADYTFPDDFEVEELRGKTGMYWARVEEVKARKLPALDDEFAKSVGGHETLADLTAAVRDMLTKEAESETENQYSELLLEQVLEGAALKYPPQMVEHELEHMLDDLNQELARQGLSMDIYLKSRELDLDGLKSEMSQDAARRIERSLALMEIAKREDIQVPKNVVEERLEQTVSSIKGAFSPQDTRRLTSQQVLQSLADRISSDELVRLTLRRLTQIGRGEIAEAERSASEPTVSAEQS